jgi:hypothetical protein
MSPYYDYAASIAALIQRLKDLKASSWSPTPHVKKLNAFAKQLDAAADLMDEPEGMEVESAFDTDPPLERGFDGIPIPADPAETRRGLYQFTKWQLREIADTARSEAEGYPAPQARIAVPLAADVFLHIWYQCGRARPTLYDKGEAVTELLQILESAGMPLSKERVRTALGKALDQFDPLCDRYDSRSFLVICQ